MENPEEEYEDDYLTEEEKINLEQHIIHIAYENSYRLLTAKIPFEELGMEDELDGLSSIISYDPTQGIQKEELENMIAYYLKIDESEYYLRCAELKKILDGLPDEVEL